MNIADLIIVCAVFFPAWCAAVCIILRNQDVQADRDESRWRHETNRRYWQAFDEESERVYRATLRDELARTARGDLRLLEDVTIGHHPNCGFNGPCDCENGDKDPGFQIPAMYFA